LLILPTESPHRKSIPEIGEAGGSGGDVLPPQVDFDQSAEMFLILTNSESPLDGYLQKLVIDFHFRLE
jgi:hypothetical protein